MKERVAAFVFALIVVVVYAQVSRADATAISTGHEFCYAYGDGLWLRSVKGERATKISPAALRGGSFHTPLWINRETVLFIYEPHGSQGQSRVGILNVGNGSVKWISALAGVGSVGLDSSKQVVDYVKVGQFREGDAVEVLCGQYDLKTGRSKAVKAYYTWGGLHYSRIYRWPSPQQCLLPRENSDVSDQVLVYDIRTRKEIQPKLFTENWRIRHFSKDELGSNAIFYLAAGPGDLVAVVIIGANSGLYLVDAKTDSARRLRTSHKSIENPCFSADGKRIAWSESDGSGMVTNGTSVIWVASLDATGVPTRICDGWDPTWRP